MSLAPVPAEQPDATCANCAAPLVADQRYCLNCGQPVSPVRLAFLDVLSPAGGATAGTAPAAYVPPGTIDVAPTGFVAVPVQGGGANAWLRRNSGLLGLVAILALFLLAGLLVGHWVSQSKSPGNTTVKIEGLSGLAAGTATPTTTSSTPSTETGSTGSTSKTSAKQEAKEKAEGEKETAKEKAPPPAPKAVTKEKITKLSKSTGKKHQEEINALGAEPIETH